MERCRIIQFERKMMKKKKMKTFIALIALTLAFGVQADSYLYWMIGDSVTLKNGETTTENFSGYQYTKVGVLDNASGLHVGYLTFYVNGVDSKIETGNGKGSFYSNVSQYTDGYSFYIELFYGDTSVCRSEEILSYSAAQEYIERFGTSTPVPKPWTPTTFTTAAVPEPSSALLMLLGCAGLALKRKKQSKA